MNEKRDEHARPPAHGHLNRQEEAARHAPWRRPGMFGKMFPKARPFEPPALDLVELGRTMVESDAMMKDPRRDNVAVPAGFTYFGQFVDHDLTFDTTPMPEKQVDPHAVHNFRTPKLDLDCLYGNGPTAHPHLYDRLNRSLLLLGHNPEGKDRAGQPIPRPTAALFRNDLPRVRLLENEASSGTALIGDPRNDENLIVAQTHVALLKFHNKVVATKNVDFTEARRIVTWHYQSAVLHDFIGRLVGPEVLKRVIDQRPRFYKIELDAYMPIEFSVAAYRFGHTMVRERYSHNRVFGPGFADLDTLFSFTELSGTNSKSDRPFHERVPVPDSWIIDWNRFYSDAGAAPGADFNFSRRLDPFLTPKLGDLPNGSPDPDRRNLAILNLLRGLRMQLPSGQAVAKELELRPDEVLKPNQFGDGPDAAVAKAKGFDIDTPLWYYILKEAEMLGNNGARLGPVGATIVAEVFVGVLLSDELSMLRAGSPFKPDPELGGKGDHYTVFDLLKFVDEMNPLG